MPFVGRHKRTRNRGSRDQGIVYGASGTPIKLGGTCTTYTCDKYIGREHIHTDGRRSLGLSCENMSSLKLQSSSHDLHGPYAENIDQISIRVRLSPYSSACG